MALLRIFPLWQTCCFLLLRLPIAASFQLPVQRSKGHRPWTLLPEPSSVPPTCERSSDTLPSGPFQSRRLHPLFSSSSSRFNDNGKEWITNSNTVVLREQQPGEVSSVLSQQQQKQQQQQMPPLNLTSTQIRSLPSNDRFRYRIRQLLLHKQTHGHFRVLRKQDKGLANWINTQRYEYRSAGSNSMLTPERIELLEKIGFDWRMEEHRKDGLTPIWLDQYERLEDYMDQHGHICVSPEANKSLSKFLANQRQMYKQYMLLTKTAHPLTHEYSNNGETNGAEHTGTAAAVAASSSSRGSSGSSSSSRNDIGRKAGGMTQARIDKLEALGMVWNTRTAGKTRYDSLWEQRFSELQQFKQKHGHLHVDRGCELSVWISQQRRTHRNRIKYNISSLTLEREKALQEIGFDFDGVRSWKTDAWKRSYHELEAFYQRHNHTLIIADSNSSLSTLSNWVTVQRQEYRKTNAGRSNYMTPERQEALETIGFSWNIRTSQWMAQYAKLQDFKNTYNHTRVPGVHPPDVKFGRWVTSQRAFYRQAMTMTTTISTNTRTEQYQRKVQLLTEIELLRDGKDGKDGKNNRQLQQSRQPLVWDDMLQKLVVFQDSHGHCSVPQKSNQLGTWVNRQRTQGRLYQQGKLSALTADRVQALDDIGFDWNAPKNMPTARTEQRNVVWSEHFQDLERFHQKHGHCRVPGAYVDAPKLADWVGNTRRQYRLWKKNGKSSMTAKRAQALESIDFDCQS